MELRKQHLCLLHRTAHCMGVTSGGGGGRWGRDAHTIFCGEIVPLTLSRMKFGGERLSPPHIMTIYIFVALNLHIGVISS